MESKKGMHNKNRDPPVHRMNDFSIKRTKRRRSFRSFSARASATRWSSTWLPVTRSACPFPRKAPSSRSASPAFAVLSATSRRRRALAYTRNKILQREVEIEVDSVDRSGIFLGTLIADQGRLNLGEEILRAGLGSLHPSFPADRCGAVARSSR